jgi:hypothetical protein
MTELETLLVPLAAENSVGILLSGVHSQQVQNSREIAESIATKSAQKALLPIAPRGQK